ncbi:tripartite motif-containing protein 3-like [Branchiostoma lanceolatum]|uniref:tripartite motif-containing protein 3-like n=1 Tax=Branchiostoma lanceolatum TaxID=7740 RepID=UPI003453C20C
MAAARLSLGEEIREELSCSICLELFTRPKVLPCQHTFCQECLQNHAGWGVPLQCPICRRKVRLPPQGVASLPDSYIVAHLCERLQQQATLSGETREQSGNRCSFHPSEEYRVYCKQCQIPICEQCLEEVHNGHGTTTIKKAAQERRDTVQALITEGRDILESYCSFIRGLRETEKTLHEEKQQTDNRIIQACNTLLSEVEQNHRKNLARVHNKRDRVLADVNELSAACDQAEKEVEDRGNGFLSQESNLAEVVGKYRGKEELSPVQTQPAVFQPVLGHVTVQFLPSTSAATATSDDAAGGTGHHHGNQSQEENQSQKVTFGGEGSGTGQFDYPAGLAVSDEGQIFVTDRGNQRIQAFTLQGTFVHQFPTVVSGEQKIDPQDLAIDGEGNLWVVGRSENDEFAMQYTKQGRVLRKFDLQYTMRWRGVAVDTRRNLILITQTTGDWPKRHGEVQVFWPDGTLVRTVGQQQGMGYPCYITVDEEGNILVSDCENHRVYVYREDGQFLFKFGGEGSGEGQLKGPHGICIDEHRNIIVADMFNSRVEMFDRTGRFLEHITADQWGPEAVAMATQGQLVVTNYANDTVTIFPSSKQEL